MWGTQTTIFFFFFGRVLGMEWLGLLICTFMIRWMFSNGTHQLAPPVYICSVYEKVSPCFCQHLVSILFFFFLLFVRQFFSPTNAALHDYCMWIINFLSIVYFLYKLLQLLQFTLSIVFFFCFVRILCVLDINLLPVKCVVNIFPQSFKLGLSYNLVYGIFWLTEYYIFYEHKSKKFL